MAAFALAHARRGGRGPAAAAMALGRRTLLAAYPSPAPTQGLQRLGRRSLATGNGTEVAGGMGIGGPGAGMGPVRSGAGCMGGCRKELLDLRAEMLDQHHQLFMRIVKLDEETIALKKSLVERQFFENTRRLKTVYWVVGTSLAFSMGFATMRHSWEKKQAVA